MEKISPSRNQFVLIAAFLLAFAFQLRAADYTVYVYSSSFSPSTLQIHVGDTVTWDNEDFTDSSHTTTSNSGLWNGLMVGIGDTYSVQFNSTGTFPYHDQFDAFSGSITVSAINSAPSVTITNPLAGAVFPAPATFTVSASATDDGSVSSVQFLVDGVSIGTDTTPNPYSATASSLSVGAHTLSAIATDNLGAKSTNSISITVNARPTISLPAGPTYNVSEGSPVSFTVNASDTDGPSVTLSASNSPAGSTFSGTSTSKTFSWTPTYGNSYRSPYTVTFLVNDGINATVTSNATINVNFVSTQINISSQVLSNNQFKFHVSGLRLTRTNFVQASTNLPNWFSIQTNISTNASFDFTNSGIVGAKFFRVLESR